jgi:hypothetical protein
MKIPSRFLPVAAMILAAALVRLMPYILGALGMQDVRDVTVFLWSFSPISALFLFGGAQFAERRWAYLVPLAAMLISDLGIGLLMGDMRMGIHPMIPAMYGSYAVIVWLGTRLREKRGVLAIAGSALAGEVAFFVITNFADWVLQTGTYPHTLAGLGACYVAGIPFFRKLLISMAVYAVALFGGLAVIERRFAAVSRAQAVMPSSNQPSAA